MIGQYAFITHRSILKKNNALRNQVFRIYRWIRRIQSSTFLFTPLVTVMYLALLNDLPHSAAHVVCYDEYPLQKFNKILKLQVSHHHPAEALS